MALAYFGVLLFTIFSGLFFIYSPDRAVTSPNISKVSVAGIFSNCQEAAVAYALTDSTIGATGGGTSRSCNSTSLGGTPRVTALGGIGSINDVIKVHIEPTKNLLPSAPANERTVSVYLPMGTAIAQVPFQEVVTEIMEASGSDINMGTVVANGATGRKIMQYSSSVVSVSSSLGIGDFVVVTNIY